MKIFVTGVAGYIGASFTYNALSAGHSIIGIDNFSNSSDRNLKLINKAINQYLEMECNSMISVSRMKESIFNCIEFQDNEKIKWKYIDPPLKKNHQRQELKDKTAHIDGNFYIFSNQFLRKNNSVISQEETVPYLIDSKYSIDIDEEEDFIIANLILQSLTNES